MTDQVVDKLGDVAHLKLSEVKPAEGNPRRIPEKAVEVVAESLKRFGWQQPLVVDKAGTLLAGHTRYQAAKLLKLKEVPVVVAEKLTDDEAAAYRIADNRTHDFSSWDLPELVKQLDALDGDFADVLALEDWRSLVDQFEEDMSLNVSDEAATDMSGGGFELVLSFVDKATALAAEQACFKMDGCLDVRHRRA